MYKSDSIRSSDIKRSKVEISSNKKGQICYDKSENIDFLNIWNLLEF